ncbi:BnaC04g54090D [Brassica napus]|uniref:BnaC04g54090D protein n=1 Tax=Brassica napus TaxID=3708 RepID=A0A078IQM7_BRANA|nr:BnaC04g54090D [Brassica napus]
MLAMCAAVHGMYVSLQVFCFLCSN